MILPYQQESNPHIMCPHIILLGVRRSSFTSLIKLFPIQNWQNKCKLLHVIELLDVVCHQQYPQIKFLHLCQAKHPSLYLYNLQLNDIVGDTKNKQMVPSIGCSKRHIRILSLWVHKLLFRISNYNERRTQILLGCTCFSARYAYLIAILIAFQTICIWSPIL